MNKTCLYFCEGEDDQKLINALKYNPERILSGRSKTLNVMQTLIPKSVLLGIKPNSCISLVFDTDVVTNLQFLKTNINNIKKYCHGVRIVCLLQVKNLEDELVRCTDVKNVLDITKSKTLSNFKADFKKLSDDKCRRVLDNHKIDVKKLWTTNAPEVFSFVERNSHLIKK